MDYGREISPKEMIVNYEGREIRYFNQTSSDWTHPYEYQGDGSNLHKAGCGIFSMGFAIQWMNGIGVDIEELADFSCKCGGRGDDGTDRPALLGGMVRAGLDAKYRFRYDGDGLINDHAKLWEALSNGGCALLNLRVGHIVAAVACREAGGEKQILVIDSACESADRRVRDMVREVAPDSAVAYRIRNKDGIELGMGISHGIYWAPLRYAMDFNLLYKR
ncbi:MAG: hypothetical protein ACOYI5_00990 [Christensenellales bacterium]